MEMPMEKGQLGPQPSKRHLLKDEAGGTGGDGAGTGPRQPSPSHTSRVSFSSRLQSSRSRPSSARLLRGQRSAVPSPAPLPPPANTAARGQCRRLRSCVACSGKVTPDNFSTVPSTPSTPASTETEPPLVHQLTQTEPETSEQPCAPERVDRDIQTESPGRERRISHVRLFMDRETQTQSPAMLPSAASAAREEPEPPRPRQRRSLFRRLLRACRCSCTGAQPEQLGASPGPKTPQHPQGAAQGHTAGIRVLMVIQESTEGTQWSPYSSWPWLVETSL
ncbi:serine/arginine repetitive matrix protein 1-like isoform X2 [Vidua macroura]|uniref:serine/arginine repetitive matrix protein 1-like isoform X2 n=1 Tax=Vidua macroura TaxID=187451 RepID=UPI0023A7B462|nr:serine/arginine repetitive matrix protein 1-like isoform X2 [Vidua macroura]